MADQRQGFVITEVPVAFDSTDGKSCIRGRVWCRQSADKHLIAEAKGLIIIAHGMSEHSLRYKDFAHMLVEAGYIVSAHDHVGHGKSAAPNKWGKLTEDAATTMIEDLHQMRQVAESFTTKDVPVYLFGHSMGSFIVRCYLAKYAEGITGAIICGTGYIAPAKGKAALTLGRAIVGVKGAHTTSKLLHNASIGAYAKSIKGAKTDADWLSYSQDNVMSYRKDGACGFPFSAGGMVAVAKLAYTASLHETVEAYPKDIALLFISGADDPVGDMGKGVTKSVELIKVAGITDVTCTLYQRMRHEILNEIGHEIVYRDIVEWLELHA